MRVQKGVSETRVYDSVVVASSDLKELVTRRGILGNVSSVKLTRELWEVIVGIHDLYNHVSLGGLTILSVTGIESSHGEIKSRQSLTVKRREDGQEPSGGAAFMRSDKRERRGVSGAH